MNAAQSENLSLFISNRICDIDDAICSTPEYQRALRAHMTAADRLKETFSTKEQQKLFFALDNAEGETSALLSDVCYFAGLLKGVLIGLTMGGVHHVR